MKKIEKTQQQQQPQLLNLQVQKKKLSNKQIYRLLAFEFRQGGNGIKLSIISEMVANLFYPFQDAKEPRESFKELIERSFRSFCYKDEINEESFCQAMDSIEKYITPETTERFLFKIFKRHDKDKDNLLNREEFTALMKNYNNINLSNKEIDNVYDSMLQQDAKGIDFKTFLKHSS